MPEFTTTSLKKYNTFGFDINAENFACFADIEACKALLHSATEMQLPVRILGGGSNILLTQPVSGVLLKNEMKGMRLLQPIGDKQLVACAAGESWHHFVLWTLQQGLQGLENLSLIPGTVGAAPIQNIGAYGVEIKDYFHSLTALNIESHEVQDFTIGDCAFGYRESIFKHKLAGQYIISEVRFLLNTLPQYNTSYGAIQEVIAKHGVEHVTATAISNAVIAIRKSKLPDPEEIGNAGSFFKNPEIATEMYNSLIRDCPAMPCYKLNDSCVKVPAGWLIEQCGWKGYIQDGVGVHKLQALVLVNYGTGKGDDVYKLSTEIIASVQKKFDISLEREVNIW
jgi:UDP-N-acetylmuramate dehydrogenase